jgi:hypothetical protein
VTLPQAMRVLRVMRAAWPHRAVSNETAHVYMAMMRDLTYDEATSAVQALIQTSKWFPSIAEIRARVATSRCALEAPELAWGQVQRAISKYGAYQTPVFASAALHQAVESLGWRNICLDENLAATRARFIDAYRVARERRIDEEATGRRLPGRAPAQLEAGEGDGE